MRNFAVVNLKNTTMKQFLFGVSLLACISAMAQINHPLVEEGKVWHYVASNDHPIHGLVEWDETYSLEGDTAISSFLCQKLYFSSTYPFYSSDHKYMGAMYETGKKVYYIAPSG